MVRDRLDMYIEYIDIYICIRRQNHVMGFPHRSRDERCPDGKKYSIYMYTTTGSCSGSHLSESG